MTEILTESFCERCGTRYTFESARPKARLTGVRVLSRGLKNFVLSDDTSMDEAMAAARNETDREQTAQQLDAFHKTFNFCMSCRQYTCPNCWNEVEARCLSCAPNLGREVLPAPFPDLTAGPLVSPDTPELNGANGSNGTAHGAELIGLAEVQGTRPDAEVDAAARLAALTGPAEAPVVEEPAATAAPVDEEPVAFVVSSPDIPPAAAPDIPPAAAPDIPLEIVEAGIGGATPATDGGAFDAEAATTPFDETTEDRTAGDMAGFAARLAAASSVAKAARGTEPERTKRPAGKAAPEGDTKAAAQAGALPGRSRPDPDPEPAAQAVEPEAIPTPGPEAAAAAEPALEAADTVADASAPEAPEAPVAAGIAIDAVAAHETAADTVLAAEAAIAADEAALVDQPEAALAADVVAPEASPEPEAIVEAVAPIEPEITATETAAAEIAAAAAVVDVEKPVAAEPEATAPADAPEESLPAAAAADVPAAPEPAVAPEPAPPVADDVVRQPVWQMVAPDTDATVESPAPAAPTSEPQWPARPEWPTTGRSAVGLPFLGRPAAPQGGIEALWAESTSKVTTPTPSGRTAGVVQPCISCGLSLSANARFCRRCGTAQGG
jgi:hypothetical protein